MGTAIEWKMTYNHIPENKRQNMKDMRKYDTIGRAEFRQCDIPNFDAGKDYFVFRVVGGCMHHEDCPVPIPDGARVLAHWLGMRDFVKDWQSHVGRLIHVSPLPGIPGFARPIVKQFMGMDYDWFIRLRCYRPRREFAIAVDWCEQRVAIVDLVVNDKNVVLWEQ